eukprot:1184813-Prorocentrum_minimum.AAC.2
MAPPASDHLPNRPPGFEGPRFLLLGGCQPGCIPRLVPWIDPDVQQAVSKLNDNLLVPACVICLLQTHVTHIRGSICDSMNE